MYVINIMNYFINSQWDLLVPFFCLLFSEYGQTSTSWRLLTTGCGMCRQCWVHNTKMSRCRTVVLITLEADVVAASGNMKSMKTFSSTICWICFRDVSQSTQSVSCGQQLATADAVVNASSAAPQYFSYLLPPTVLTYPPQWPANCSQVRASLWLL